MEGADMNKVRVLLELGMPVSAVSQITGYGRMHVRRVCWEIRRERGGFQIKREVIIAASIIAFLLALPYLLK